MPLFKIATYDGARKVFRHYILCSTLQCDAARLLLLVFLLDFYWVLNQGLANWSCWGILMWAAKNEFWRTFPPFEKYLFLIWISKCFHVNSISGCYELSCVSGQELVETASFIAMEAGHCTTSPWPRPRRMYLCQIFTDGSEVVTKLLT